MGYGVCCPYLFLILLNSNMSLINLKNKKIVYTDERLNFPLWQNIILRIGFFVFLMISGICGLVLLNSDLKGIGIIILIIIINYIITISRPEETITLDTFNKDIIKIDSYISEQNKNLVLNTFLDCLVKKTDFYLEIFYKLIQDPNISKSLQKIDIDVVKLREDILDQLKIPINTLIRKEDISNYMSLAFIEAIGLRENYISKRALFLALFQDDYSNIFKLKCKFQIDKKDLYNALILSSIPVPKPEELSIGVGDFVRLRMKYGYRFKVNRSWTARPTDYLDEVGIDLTDLASKMKLGFLVGHEQEFDSLMNVLARPGRNNVLLVGEPGTGKETMVANLAIKIIKDEVPGNLFDKRLVALNIGNVTSGANNVGELQNRFQKLAKEMLEAGNIVLYIPNIYTLKQTNVEGAGINAADLLKPIFQSGLVPVIGTATEQEYRRLLDTDVEFAGMFEIIRLQEISEDEAIQILSYEALSLEKQYRIVISYKAIKRAVFLSKRYLRDKLLPASATDLLRETVVYIKSIGKKIVSEDDIIDMVEAKTRIPMANVTKQEAEQLLNLEDKLHQRMIDQEEAIKSVAEALREYRAGLSNKSGPIASFLFVGPTGVGKTELAKSLAVIYFGSESKMIRFDMTEYQDVESVQRFIGSPDGEKLGALTEAVRIHPFSLILLDEFEKASQNIMNLFLQVFDDGRLTDSTNRVIDFSNTIIIATSNALSSFIKEELDKGTEYKQLSEQIKLKLTSVYTPEMLNRFSKILVFKPLSPDDILEITKLQIKNLAEQIFNDKEIKLSVSDSAIAELARLGFDPVFGARPLQGVIREKIKSEIANKILKQELVSGDEIIIDFQNNEFTYTKIKIF